MVCIILTVLSNALRERGGRDWLLIAVTHAANHHKVTLMKLTFELYMMGARPEKLVGGKVSDSDALDAELAE